MEEAVKAHRKYTFTDDGNTQPSLSPATDDA